MLCMACAALLWSWWCDLAWRGAEYGMVWYGTVWYGTVWYIHEHLDTSGQHSQHTLVLAKQSALPYKYICIMMYTYAY